MDKTQAELDAKLKEFELCHTEQLLHEIFALLAARERRRGKIAFSSRELIK